MRLGTRSPNRLEARLTRDTDHYCRALSTGDQPILDIGIFHAVMIIAAKKEE